MAARAVFPISLLLEGRPCLVVGGRATAQLRVEGLLEAGAVVTVIAPEVTGEVAALPVTLHRRAFAAGDTKGFVLVVSATGDPEVDAKVHADGREHGALVNAVDNPASCDLYLPAVLRRGPVTVAISTGGASPAIASWARDRIESALGETTGELAHLVARVRDDIRSSGTSSEGLPWRALIEELAGALESGATDEEAQLLATRWRASVAPARRPGDLPGRAGSGSADG